MGAGWVLCAVWVLGAVYVLGGCWILCGCWVLGGCWVLCRCWVGAGYCVGAGWVLGHPHCEHARPHMLISVGNVAQRLREHESEAKRDEISPDFHL